MPPALVAPVEIGDLIAQGTAPATDFDLDNPAFFMEADLGIVLIRLLDMCRGGLERPPCTTGVSEREEDCLLYTSDAADE